MKHYIERYFMEASAIMDSIDKNVIEDMITRLANLRKNGGRLFLLGVGGSAGNASHAVNDFRKISDIEAYAPTDNVSELTARINDDGWDTSFVEWLRGSRLTSQDMVMVFRRIEKFGFKETI